MTFLDQMALQLAATAKPKYSSAITAIIITVEKAYMRLDCIHVKY